MKKFGFTLSEVLITVGIIGVIAALTVPALVKNYQKTVYVTSLHKFYNEMDSAIKQYMTDQHVDDLRESDLYGSSDGLKEFLNNYLKVTKNCGESYIGCFNSTYNSLFSDTETELKNWKCNVNILLADGAALCIDTVAMEATKNENNEDVISSNHVGSAGEVLAFEVDINGAQPPNIFARDMFAGVIKANGEVSDKWYTEGGKFPYVDGVDSGAFGKIMNEGWKMNY